MCGIVGYIGEREAAPILLDGLSHLEYRGYDSAGLAVIQSREEAVSDPGPSGQAPSAACPTDGGTVIAAVKAKGKIQVLREMTDDGQTLHGHCGIGHTRWATHGEPSAVNAHPHLSGDNRVAVVHNGIIENYRELREKLERRGCVFRSQTDTEVTAHLLDEAYRSGVGGTRGAIDAIRRLIGLVRGSYALGILFADQPGVIYAVRQDSPLVIGCHREDDGQMTEGYLASDATALLAYTRQVYYPENRDIVRLCADSVHFFRAGCDADDPGDLRDVTTEYGEPKTVEWEPEAVERGGFAHFMMKEIHEQPDAVRDTIHPRIENEDIHLEDAGLTDEILRDIRRIRISACGSAYHVGMVGKYVLEALCRVPVEVDIASEFRYSDPVLDDPAHTLLLVISQSGETADTLAALRLAKGKSIRTLAILNVVGSTMAREADHVLYTWAGPEIAVATTKAYSAQLAALYLFAVRLAWVRETVDQDRYHQLIRDMSALPDQIRYLLEDKERIQWFANKYAGARDIFFIGRGIDYALSLEGSLKLKEISYIHSEAYAAGELKHGTISLIEEGTPVVGIATQPALYAKTVSNMTEVRTRGAMLFGLTQRGHYDMEDVADFTVYLPRTDDFFTASLGVIPLQLFAYYVSCAKGLDVDKPRNLAKSVTVE